MTSEQRDAYEFLRGLAAPHRFRVRPDVEGWPIIPGRLGQIEWVDAQTIAVYSDRPAMFRKIFAVSGVRRHQTGDKEIRVLAPPTALVGLANLIQARKRKILSEAQRQKLAEHGYRATSRGQKGGENPETISQYPLAPILGRKSP